MDAGPPRAALMRGRDPGGRWPGRGCRLRTDHATEVVELVTAAGEVLDPALFSELDQSVDYSTARGILGTVWTAALDALTVVDPRQGLAPRPPADLVELMRAVKELDERILVEQIRFRDKAFQSVRDALSTLYAVSSTAALIQMAPVAVCSLGFDRAIVSRVADSLWIPEKVHVAQDARWADEILEAGRAQPQVLNGALVETEMIRRKISIRVDQVQEQPGVHRPIAEASMSRSYTAAPIMVQGAVAGFVHGDCYYQQRNVDETDQQVLLMFAEGLGQALSRTMVLDRLDALRTEIDAIALSVSAAGSPASGPWCPVPGEDGATLLQPRRHGNAMENFLQSMPSDPLLTRREVEVLRLMAAGDTNARIARRLVISEGTVKSHVKHVLRKLGAANRAEAVSHWLRIGHEQRRGHDRIPDSQR